MDVGGWLRSLGLGQFEDMFHDNGVDGAVLPKLTSDDLKEMGIAGVGHRRKILSAIMELSGSSAAPSEVATPGAAPTPTPPARDAAERRQLTVMFCDLVGSTAMSARLDPEDMREIIGAYHRCCATLIASNGGFVAKYMGDGVLAYFGYPMAHEHDAERAVRAGLDIVEAAPSLETEAGAPLHVRVGIATGIVVVGDLLGSGEAQERGIVGDTPNLAARLQAIAEPDSVVIGDGTRRLLGNLFELADLGARELKGIAGPTRAFAALRTNPLESRFEALHASSLTSLVGREEELDLLVRRWAWAKAGQGQVVLVSGEAGIGKSRLTAAFLERLAGEPHIRMRYFCSPQHTDSALYPIIGHLERAAGLTRDDGPRTKLDKLDALLARSATAGEDAGLIADMLSLPNDGRYPTLSLAPQQRRYRMLEALVSQVAALSRREPVLMIFEDAHWSDPSSLEAFGQIVDRLKTSGALLLVTSRPEFEPPWIGLSHVSTLTINRLTHRDVEVLIERVVGARALPAHIRQDIVDRADGIPLFVEEMTKAVLEAESEGAAARMMASVPSPSLAVPASLHASLMARLDRLGEAKAVAQIGAAIGREFSHALLAAVARESAPDLDSALRRLVEAGLLFRQGAPPHATYLFKHALVQDAAYGILLREPRRALHARIAEALENQFADIAENRPELLARHCAEAGLIEKAANRWGRAGQQSLARSALVESETQFARALALVGTLPGTPSQRREQIALQVGLCNAQMHTKGFAASETKASLDLTLRLIERAEALGEPLEDPLILFSVLYGIWLANYTTFNGDAIRQLAAQFLGLAEQRKAITPIMIGRAIVAVSAILTGDVADGRAHYDRAIALYDPAEHRPLAMRFGYDVRGSILIWRALALWLLGYPEAAQADIRFALEDARDFKHAVSLMNALNATMITQIFVGNYEAAIAQFDELVVLADAKGTPFWKESGEMKRGCLFAIRGEAAKAVQAIDATIAARRSTGATVSNTYYLSHSALAHAVLGQFDEAGRSLDQALSIVQASGERWYEAEIHRTAGEIALLPPERDAAKAQAHFERALRIARAQQARSLELRAAMSLARVWRDQGEAPRACVLLAPLYGWFTEGFDTLDLRAAKALLDELAS